MAVMRQCRHVCARALFLPPPRPSLSLTVVCFARAFLLSPSLVFEGEMGVAREYALENSRAEKKWRTVYSPFYIWYNSAFHFIYILQPLCLGLFCCFLMHVNSHTQLHLKKNKKTTFFFLLFVVLFNQILPRYYFFLRNCNVKINSKLRNQTKSTLFLFNQIIAYTGCLFFPSSDSNKRNNKQELLLVLGPHFRSGLNKHVIKIK